MARYAGDDPSAEKAASSSWLLAFRPSAGSTNRPSRSNLSDYGSSDGALSKNDSAASFEVLLPNTGEEQRIFSKIRRCHRKHAIVVVVLLLACCGLAALIISSASGSSEIDTRDSPKGKSYRHATEEPFSMLDPVKDLGLYSLQRPKDTSPPESIVRDSPQQALPTNAWYQNLLMVKGEPSSVHRAYSQPYIVDVVGPIPGLRAHPNHLDASTTVVQLSFVDAHGLTLGAAPRETHNESPTMAYSVVSTTALAATLQWDILPMSASIVKGMPYLTMHYPKPISGQDFLPSIVSEMDLSAKPVADSGTVVECGKGKVTRVDSELKLTFSGSDFTWLIFFSEPVMLQCIEQPESIDGAAVAFQVKDVAHVDEATTLDSLIVRAALLTNCTDGENQIFCRHQDSPSHIEKYEKILRERAHLYPGPNADVGCDIDNEKNEAVLKFNWDVRNMKAQADDALGSHLRRLTHADDDEALFELVTYALPHHLNRMQPSFMPWGEERFCTQSLIGSMCVVSGSTWELVEELPPIAFQAPRPPRPETIGAIADALQTDLSYQIANYYQRGAGDTYFSGKMLARMARVLLIAEELNNLCHPDNHRELGYTLTSQEKKAYATACNSVLLPSHDEMNSALSRLRSSTEVWINGTAEIPFVYDSEWGGVISCGCQFDSQLSDCSNIFPNCPAVVDPGMNFGNGFFNDHHFHYGYHIHAAAAVAHFDNEWGRKHFEQVQLLVRDIANPSSDDVHFPRFRQKDWYQGNSWASGVPIPPYPNGKNQESSSEAIASYEAVSLFGKAMANAWHNAGNDHMAKIASNIYNVGRVLTATEVRAADYYWHVRRHDASMKIYPSVYAQNAVGIFWNTMAQFQTWFGSASYLAIGIQLLPLTAISESRDDPSWIRELYPEFAESCGAVNDCINQGWSILQLATLATVGHARLAVEKAKQLSPDVFDSAGGNGHSMSNTLWYLATRPRTKPLELPEMKRKPSSPEEDVADVVDCGIPEACTNAIMERDAKGSTCRQRISWLVTAMGLSEHHACYRVSNEFPSTCGPCNPGDIKEVKDADSTPNQCTPCTKEECLSDLNRCPLYETTFVCTKGVNIGGCSRKPWDIGTGLCSSCCDVSACRDYENFESPNTSDVIDVVESEEDETDSCIECDKDVCKSKLNLCPIHTAPYLCMEGKNSGGCSPWPWNNGECEKCCDLKLTCGE